MAMANSSARLFAVTASLALTAGAANAAAMIARTPTISGNGWVALGIIGGFVAVIYTLIMGALHVERRDAHLGRRGDRGDHGWFGFTRDDDDDAPDHHNGGESN
jgi:hypothetical protein